MCFFWPNPRKLETTDRTLKAIIVHPYSTYYFIFRAANQMKRPLIITLFFLIIFDKVKTSNSYHSVQKSYPISFLKSSFIIIRNHLELTSLQFWEIKVNFLSETIMRMITTNEERIELFHILQTHIKIEKKCRTRMLRLDGGIL